MQTLLRIAAAGLPNAAAGLVLLALGACSLVPPADFPRESQVDVSQYMGAWYVIANIPPKKTAHAYNSIERYTQTKPGVIKTVFTYRDGGFDAPLKTIKPTGYVIDGTGGAVWGMSFFWPLKLQYIISYVGPGYRTTIVARQKRDLVWVLARTPRIDAATYKNLVRRVALLGYDTSKLRKVPQKPLSERDDLHAGAAHAGSVNGP